MRHNISKISVERKAGGGVCVLSAGVISGDDNEVGVEVGVSRSVLQLL